MISGKIAQDHNTENFQFQWSSKRMSSYQNWKKILKEKRNVEATYAKALYSVLNFVFNLNSNSSTIKNSKLTLTFGESLTKMIRFDR